MSQSNGNNGDGENDLVPVSDLSQLDVKKPAEAGTPVHIKHPATNEPVYFRNQAGEIVPFTIDLLGADAGVVQAYMDKVNDRHIEAYRKNQNPAKSKALVREKINGLVLATTRWQCPPIDGKWLEFTPENARELYGDPRFTFIREQLHEELMNRARFFTSASPS